MKFILPFAALILLVRSQSLYQYKKISNSYTIMDINYNTQYLIGSIDRGSVMSCMAWCSQLASCMIILVATTTCKFYAGKTILIPAASTNEMWFKQTTGGVMTVFNNSDTSLTSYWPIFDGIPIDLKTGVNLTSQNPTYGVDQYGSSGGTIKTTNSTTYWTAPSGIYFWGDFTFMGWVKPMSCGSNTRYFEFAFATNTDSVLMSYSYNNPAQCLGYVYVYKSTVTFGGNYNLAVPIPVNQWTHLTMSLCGLQTKFLINAGSQTNLTTAGILPAVRLYNYFGKSAWLEDDYANAEFDEIKIYNRCLSGAEIVYDKNNVKSLLYTVSP